MIILASTRTKRAAILILIPKIVSPINPNVVDSCCANDDNYSESLVSFVPMSDTSDLRGQNILNVNAPPFSPVAANYYYFSCL